MFYFTATKLRHFSDVNLGISIPGRGQTSDLLNADGDKNDYDWWVAFLIWYSTLSNHIEFSYYLLLSFFMHSNSFTWLDNNSSFLITKLEISQFLVITA